MTKSSVILKQVGLMIGLFLSVSIAFWFVLWMQKPLYKVLVSEADQINFEKVIPILQSNNYEYAVDIENNILFVEIGYYNAAVRKLRETDIIPNGTENVTSTQGNCEWSYKAYYFESVKMIFGLLIMIVFVFGAFRPLIKKLEAKNK